MTEKNIKQSIEELDKKISELGVDKSKKKNKKNKFNMPFYAKVSNRRIRNNYVTVMMILENGAVKFSREQIIGNTLLIDGSPYVITPKNILAYKKKPIVIIPNYSMKAFDPVSHYDETVRNQETQAGYELILKRMLLEGVGKKRGGISGGLILTIIILAIVAYYFFSSGGPA